MPAPMALTAPKPSMSVARSPKVVVELAPARAPRRAGSRGRPRAILIVVAALTVSDVQLLARYMVRRRETRAPGGHCPDARNSSTSRSLAMPTTVPGMRGGGLPHHRAVGRRIGARQGRRGRAGVDRDAAFLRELHRLRVQHPGAGFRHLLRFLVRQRAGCGRGVVHDPRIRGVDAVDVRADLAPLGAERRRQRHGGRVAAAAPERGHLAPVRDALVARDDDDPAARELVLDAERPHFDDPRVDVAIVRDDARLAAGEADGVTAQLAHRHREERHRDALARRQQHVELAPIGVGRDLLGEPQQLVGRVAHRRDDDDDVVALPASCASPARRRAGASCTSATLLPPYFCTTTPMVPFQHNR